MKRQYESLEERLPLLVKGALESITGPRPLQMIDPSQINVAQLMLTNPTATSADSGAAIRSVPSRSATQTSTQGDPPSPGPACRGDRSDVDMEEEITPAPPVNMDVDQPGDGEGLETTGSPVTGSLPGSPR